jgi:hypothetical protein
MIERILIVDDEASVRQLLGNQDIPESHASMHEAQLYGFLVFLLSINTPTLSESIMISISNRK